MWGVVPLRPLRAVPTARRSALAAGGLPVILRLLVFAAFWAWEFRLPSF